MTYRTNRRTGGTFMIEQDEYTKEAKQMKKDIDTAKKKLIAKARRKGMYENFGGAELRTIRDKYSQNIYYDSRIMSQLRDVQDWIDSYEG